MATPWTTRKRLSLLWSIATWAVIAGVVLFIAARTASPVAFVLFGAVGVIIAFLIRRYRYVKRMGSAGSTPDRIR